MIVDKKTLKDLEIFESTGKSIFEILDKTRTSGGSFRLKNILKTPLKNIDEINKRQESLKWIAENVNLNSFGFEESKMSYLEYYISSNIVSIKRENYFMMLVKGIRYRLFYKNHYDYFIKSLAYIKDFFIEINTFYSYFKNKEIPEELRVLLKNIAFLVEEKNVKTIMEKVQIDKIGLYKVFLYDNIIRSQMEKLIKAIISDIYQFDALISLVKAIKEKEMSFPKFISSEESIINIKGLFHLALDKPIRNDIEASKHLIFLTGANMAGKTTFIKSYGVAVYLAHLGIGVPAEKMELSIFDGIITGIETADNISLGYSFFYSEVSRVKEAIQLMKDNNKVLLLFDEMFKGTNVKDAYSASERVINGLAKNKKGIYIISSHLIELEEVIKSRDEIAFKCFKLKYENNEIKFSYKLEEGVSADRIGMYIMEEAGIFKMLE